MIAALLLSTALLVPAVQQPAPPALTRADDQRSRVHYQNGWSALNAESWDEAAREFSAAIEINDKFTLAYYGLGRAHMGAKRFVEASHAFERCRDLYLRANGQKFSSQLDANRVREDQETELREAIRVTSQGPQSARTADMLRQFQNQLRQVRQDSDRGQNIGMETSVPGFVSLSLGSAYFRAERLADAEREYKSAVAADAKLGEAWNNLAVVYMMTGRYTDAESAVKSAEKAGYHVPPGLKDDIKKGKGN